MSGSPVQPVVVVISLYSSHPYVLIETEIPLQSTKCECQQCLHCEWWENEPTTTTATALAATDATAAVVTAAAVV